MEPTPTHTRLFEEGSQPEDFERASEQIQKLGGSLHFTIEKNEEGWSTQCKEVSGIITGGSNPNPTNYEIEHQIRAAVHAAFHVAVISPEKLQSSVSEFSFSVAPPLIPAHA